MGHRAKRKAGPQRHAEGQHGEKTHRHFIQQLHQAAALREPATERAPIEGHHRLSEGREQHDEAEKSSELTEEHGHTH